MAGSERHCGVDDDLRVARSQQHFLQGCPGDGWQVGFGEGLQPAFPRCPGRLPGLARRPDLGMDQLLGGAVAKELPGPALGGDGVGAFADAELGRSRPGQAGSGGAGNGRR